MQNAARLLLPGQVAAFSWGAVSSLLHASGPLSAVGGCALLSRCASSHAAVEDEETGRRMARSKRRHLKERLQGFQPGCPETYTRDPNPGANGAGASHAQSSQSAKPQASGYKAEDDFYNVHFQSLPHRHRPAGTSWQQQGPAAERAGGAEPRRGPDKAARSSRGGAGAKDRYSHSFKSKDDDSDSDSDDDSSSSSRRSSSRRSSSSSSSSQRSRPGAPEQGARGSDWFFQRWGRAGSTLDLEELEELFFKQRQWQRQGEKRRGKRQARTKEQSLWEDEAGAWSSYTHSAPGAKAYSRVFQEDERSWFEHWQASQRAGGSKAWSWQGRPQAGSGTGPGTSAWEHGSFTGGHASSSSARHSPAVMSHLVVLGLGSGTALERSTLKSAFHKAAKQWHPDLHIGQLAKAAAEEKFKLAAEAYETLVQHVK